jgi:integrase
MMARELNKLAAVSLNRLPCPPRSPEGEQRSKLYCDGGGLWLQVTSEGARTWLFRFRHSGKARAMGLGPLHTVSLAEARIRARACRQLLLDGVDPIEARKAKRTATAPSLTFKECAERYIEAHAAGWRNPKHAKQWPATLAAYVYPEIGALPVAAIDRPAVLRVLAPIWDEKTETASRVRGRIESVLGWAEQHGYREGANPATWKGALEHALPAKRKVRRVVHLAALPYPELPAFITELRQQEGVAARALEFAILTAARTEEVVGAPWDELDLDERLWTVPAERMKGGKTHRVPLSEPALAILNALAEKRRGERVFRIGGREMLALLNRLRPGLTVHGMRSSFRSWASERTGFPSEVAEMALAHTVGSAVERAYQRGDLFEKRRGLAEAWAQFCAGSGAKGRVVQLQRG